MLFITQNLLGSTAPLPKNKVLILAYQFLTQVLERAAVLAGSTDTLRLSGCRFNPRNHQINHLHYNRSRQNEQNHVADRHYRYPNVSGMQREHCILYNCPFYFLMECHHAIEMHHTYADRLIVVQY